VKKRTLGLSLLAIALASAAAFGQASTKNKTPTAQQLDRLGLHYTTTSSGNYSLTFDLDGGRQQVVYVMGKTSSAGKAQFREIWSRAGTLNELPEQEELHTLLDESGAQEVGFWAIEDASDGGYNLYYSVKVPLYLTDADLGELLTYTAQTADDKEQELFDDDAE
jgi:hypothetical protein